MSFKALVCMLAIFAFGCLLLGLDIGVTSWAYHRYGDATAWAIGAPVSVFLFFYVVCVVAWVES